MFIDLMNRIADFLFWVTGGVPISESIWLMVGWVFLGTLLASLPMMWLQTTRFKDYMPLAMIFGLGVAIVLSLSPTLAQQDRMSNCRTIEENVTLSGGPVIILARECERRSNVNDNFGPWKIESINIKIDR